MLKNEDIIEDRGEYSLGQSEFDYKRTLLFQVDRIGRLPTTSFKFFDYASKGMHIPLKDLIKLQEDWIAKSLYHSVLLLRDMLSPYLDKDFIEESLPENPTNEDYMKIAHNIFSKLLKLMERKNLLLENEGEDIAEPYGT